MFASLKTAINTVLDGLSGTGKPLADVFGYMNPSPQKYPAAMIQFDGGNEVRVDSSHNTTVGRFLIRVIMQQLNSEADEDQRISIADSIIDAFRTPTNVDTLSGAVHKFDIVDIRTFSKQDDQPVFGFDLLVEGSKMQSIT